jgi:hypothetical protein
VTNARRSYSDSEELALTTQVGGYCPRCGAELFYVKNNRSYKGYELAHIYPLNPKPQELKELAGVSLLNPDVNHPDNQIPLCGRCHPRFDKPRTLKEYEELASIKQKLIDRAAQRALNGQYPLEADINRIIARLYETKFNEDGTSDLEFEPKSLEKKFDNSLPVLTQRKIHHNVADYYQYIKDEFRELELQVPGASELIYTQVRAYYLKQKSLSLSQPTIFANVVDWIRLTTSPDTPESAEIVASFFVQNCEVFE